MNIYIFGCKSFQKIISKILSKNSISEKLEEIASSHKDSGRIVKVNTVKELKANIKLDNSDNIFLIDSKKIINNSFVAKHFKFLNPKDGIEVEFLEKYEIAISVEVDDAIGVTQYILDRLETYNSYEITNIDEMKEEDVVLALSQLG